VIRAKVKEGNNYGGTAPAGTLVEVEESEIDRVPWCLERVGEPLSWSESIDAKPSEPVDAKPSEPPESKPDGKSDPALESKSEPSSEA
jgi:hypothetical protein